ncbi:hypothetical protein [Cognatiluteimonas weifangensis]|uniref:hypothetical protein n=1 Tax=Cognatiluteimonas weifangensis TaxID=2303539 RepID=UPI0011C183CF|nr:hypothetical protein [Luteimonas weifangensis]
MLVLAGLKNQLEPCLRTFKRYRHDQEAKTCLANYPLILVSSFLQEWQRLERLGSSLEIRRTLIAAEPATRRIRDWRGISRARSSMLAHGFRGKDGRLVNPTTLFGPGQVPTTFAGQLLLGELAVYAIATAISHHKAAGDNALSSLSTVWPDEELESCGIDTMAEFEQEIATLRGEIFAIDPDLERCFHGG